MVTDASSQEKYSKTFLNLYLSIFFDKTVNHSGLWSIASDSSVCWFHSVLTRIISHSYFQPKSFGSTTAPQRRKEDRQSY